MSGMGRVTVDGISGYLYSSPHTHTHTHTHMLLVSLFKRVIISCV